DISVSLPAALAELEGEARALIGKAVSRGRVAAKVSLSHADGIDNRLVFDEGLARQYVSAAERIALESGIDTRIAAADLFRAPGVFRIDESGVEPDEARTPLFAALTAALAQLVRMQEDEGSHLRQDLESRLDTIVGGIAEIRALAPQVPPAYRENLRKRLADAGLDIDLGDERLLREIALFAERCDITEELTRLGSHVTLFRSYLSSDEPMGRSLDFLCQEFHRELNTIGSKANDATIARHVVAAKTELEKIREQVQNVQ
ncbi:MAG TPA: YicC family protein, partial [Bacteroidia bacterium]|nr:YicC family protein [Bacteroidia bacterium]